MTFKAIAKLKFDFFLTIKMIFLRRFRKYIADAKKFAICNVSSGMNKYSPYNKKYDLHYYYNIRYLKINITYLG